MVFHWVIDNEETHSARIGLGERCIQPHSRKFGQEGMGLARMGCIWANAAAVWFREHLI